MKIEIKRIDIEGGDGAHWVEHWHDGVMVERSFIGAPSFWRVQRVIMEEDVRRGGDGFCWIANHVRRRHRIKADNRRRWKAHFGTKAPF